MILPSEEIQEQRRKRLEAAVEGWKAELIDLTGRNNLLYFRDLKVGTLDLAAAGFTANGLMERQKVKLVKGSAEDVDPQFIIRRARNLLKKAQIALEEKGIETLWIGYGMATWEEDPTLKRPTINAPVILIPASLEPQAGGTEFKLGVGDEPRLNPTLVHKLQTDIGLKLEVERPNQDLLGAEFEADLRRAVDWLTEQAKGVPGFSVSDRLVLANFSYSKLPMVEDLATSIEELSRHELVSALAGDPEAKEAILGQRAGLSEISVDQPDRTPPRAEFLVLDADSSQSFAINSVTAGHSLVVEGPPGTGKSQTIANLIATLMARGKTVLFVAEKRAAIEAVYRRLHQRGLEHLLLDLHDGQGKRGEFAKELEKSLEAHRSQVDPDIDNLLRQLERTRDSLNRRTDALHRKREPWDISVYEARAVLAGISPQAEDPYRFGRDQIGLTGSEARTRIKSAIEEWFRQGAPRIYREKGIWSLVRFEGHEDGPREALSAAEGALESLREFSIEMRTCSSAMGIPNPVDLEQADDLIAFHSRVRSFFDNHSEAVFDLDIDELLSKLEPAGQQLPRRVVASISSPDYREATKVAKAALAGEGGSMPRRTLYRTLVGASELKSEWIERGSSKPTPCSPPNSGALESSRETLQARLEALVEWTPHFDYSELGIEDLKTALERAVSDRDTLVAMTEIREQESILGQWYLDHLPEQIVSEGLNQETAIARFDFIWLNSILDELVFEDKTIAAGTDIDGDARRYRELDSRHIYSGAERVSRVCAARRLEVADQFKEQDSLVKRQANFAPRSRKHKPVKELFRQAPDLIKALKPCWAMSPLVVSQMLDSEAGLFDVVIFDEASQITPAEAIPSILRGKQLVVAGDSRQLPPTDFFTKFGIGINTSDEEDEEEESNEEGTENFESVLDALAGILPARMLTWHYRSRDERLIAFSNTHIYDRQLTTFPGLLGPRSIQLVKVPWETSLTDGQSPADREARVVLDMILEHAREHPEKSLGVIALGSTHANRIESLRQSFLDDLQRRAATDPQARAEADGLIHFFEGKTLPEDRSNELFFVKNLERVQGDERDVIILTVGLGRNGEDPSRIRYNFGPINREGGERRLNVAVTRAKERMALVSSIDHYEMDDGKLQKKGLQLLKAYLAYAASNGEDLGSVVAEPPELNPFERQVKGALEAKGLRLEAQYGVSGYRIDFAVRDPEDPGTFVMAIECDGASYHSSPTARERDRLRQEHLERLGWRRFHRIWSTDWFADQGREVDRVLDAYEEALTQHEPIEGSQPDPVSDTSSVPDLTSKRGPRPDFTIRTKSPERIAKLVRWIKEDTLLRTRDELYDEVFRELGFKRQGSRIKEAIEAGIDLAERDN